MQHASLQQLLLLAPALTLIFHAPHSPGCWESCCRLACLHCCMTCIMVVPARSFPHEHV